MPSVRLLCALILLACCVLAQAQPPAAITEGGNTSPDGAVEVACDLPPSLRMTNTGGMGRHGPGTGYGLCVFTSLEHAGRYQNEPTLWGLQKYMTTREGGGHPEKVDRVMAAYCPEVKYVQHTGGDLAFLRAAIASGRMISVTYSGRDPRYGSRRIAHMVNLIHLDENWACVLDNNFPQKPLWMSVEELYSRWLDMQGGWAVVLLHSPPAPVPFNGAGK